jgi:hypothetical protein
MCCLSKERNWSLSYLKISAKEICLYGIIVVASPFGGWLMVSIQLYFITN